MVPSSYLSLCRLSLLLSPSHSPLILSGSRLVLGKLEQIHINGTSGIQFVLRSTNIFIKILRFGTWWKSLPGWFLINCAYSVFLPINAALYNWIVIASACCSDHPVMLRKWINPFVLPFKELLHFVFRWWIYWNSWQNCCCLLLALLNQNLDSKITAIFIILWWQVSIASMQLCPSVDYVQAIQGF